MKGSVFQSLANDVQSGTLVFNEQRLNSRNVSRPSSGDYNQFKGEVYEI